LVRFTHPTKGENAIIARVALPERTETWRRLIVGQAAFPERTETRRRRFPRTNRTAMCRSPRTNRSPAAGAGLSERTEARRRVPVSPNEPKPDGSSPAPTVSPNEPDLGASGSPNEPKPAGAPAPFPGASATDHEDVLNVTAIVLAEGGGTGGAAPRAGAGAPHHREMTGTGRRGHEIAADLDYGGLRQLFLRRLVLSRCVTRRSLS
jgi:hypothetical protein